MRYKELFHFISARHTIHEKRAAGKQKPWTKDDTLLKYRFCNMYRELDTVTQWIADNWRTPNINDPDVWFAMAVARYVNWPESLVDVGYPVPWNPVKFVKAARSRSERGEVFYGPAYVISTNGRSGNKAQILADTVLSNLWRMRKEVRAAIALKSLTGLSTLLCSVSGVGGFMAGQIIADVKYTPALVDAEDWWTFAASGPGSRRGLNRVFGVPNIDSTMPEIEWHAKLMELQKKINPLMEKKGWEKLHAQDLQNCLCEFDKYERTRLGDWRKATPRRKYNGGVE